ncbi:MAG: histidine kinase dimerization/phospho-acceptor domain-containing protein, partial [Myxococcota bacterium]
MSLPQAALLPFEIAAEVLEIPLAEVYRDVVDLLEHPPPRISWAEFTALQRNLAHHAKTEERLQAIGQAVVEKGIVSQLARAVGLFISPTAFIVFAAKVNGQRMFPFIELVLQRDGEAVVIEMRLPVEAEPCPSFFVLNAGCFRGITRLIGLGPSRVNVELLERGARYLVRPPPSGTATALLRRLAAALLNSSAHVETVVEQNARLAEQNRDLLRALRDRDKALSGRDRFLQTVGHEIRTPMNGLTHRVTELRSELGSDHPALEVVETSARRLNRTLEMALAYAQYSSEDVVAWSASISLRALLDETRDRVPGAMVRIEAPDIWLELDVVHTRRALDEILVNAAQVSGSQEIEVRAWP